MFNLTNFGVMLYTFNLTNFEVILYRFNVTDMLVSTYMNTCTYICIYFKLCTY